MTAHISEDGLRREESVAEHTEKVVWLCREKGKAIGLSRIMALCGIGHDMGKSKRAFNDYIHADESARRRGSVAHASTGAKYFYEKYHSGSPNTKIIVEMISYAIAAHHGLFDCVDAEWQDVFSKRLGGVEDYEEACGNSLRDYVDGYETDRIFNEALEEFGGIVHRIASPFEKVRALFLKPGKATRESLMDLKLFLYACLQRLMLSVLIDSDWEATSDFMDNVDTLSKLPEFKPEEIFAKARENFDAYMKKKRNIDETELTEKEKRIFAIRNSLQEECRQFAEYPAGIYCLPIPTGGGKTLSGLAYVLEFCRKHPETERIIYVSPYISITEQNAQVFRDAIGDGDWILEHHSSVVRSEGAENEDYHDGRALRCDVDWKEPFVCTTFVQFMNALFSDKGSSIRRMHRLVNAVVIIDEVQSMPLKCVHTFNYMINFLNAVCNTNVILCTATQPTLEEAECPICYSEPKYMIKNVNERFREFERVKIQTPEIGQKYIFESLAEEIAGQEEYRSILVVLNTKSAVRKLYGLLKAANLPVEYLTTNLCAEHRSDKIKGIKSVLEKKERIIVISTNLIEAGVDLSFECVYRSMAGLDSVAQTAGRCNRNGEMDWGIVKLIYLEGENAGTMEELQQNIRTAESVIGRFCDCQGEADICEKDSLLMPKWMDMYYRDVYFVMADKMNFPIEEIDMNVIELLSRGFSTEEKKNAMNQAYKTVGQAYQVIDERSIGVIVPYEKGAEIIENIQRAKTEGEIKKWIRQAQRYTVNVRGSRLKQFEGMVQSVSDWIPNLYMVAVPGVYSMECGIEPKWETLLY